MLMDGKFVEMAQSLSQQLNSKGIQGLVQYKEKSDLFKVEGYWLNSQSAGRWIFMGADENEATRFVNVLKLDKKGF
jgi:hypothetical protein